MIILSSQFSPVGMVIAVVKVMSEQQSVEYRISPSKDVEYFKVNLNAGLITTACLLKVIEKDLYELEIYMSKGGDLEA